MNPQEEQQVTKMATGAATNAEPVPRPRKPLWRRILKWAIRVAIVLVVLGIAAFAIFNYTGAKALEKEVAKIRAAGEPVTFAELSAMTPKAEAADDSGPFYAAAIALAPADVPEETVGAFRQATAEGRAVTEAMMEPVQPVIEQHKLALEMIDLGSAKAGCNYQLGVEYGISIGMKPLEVIRRLVRMVSLRSRLLAVQGKGDEAVDSLISGLRMTRMLDRQPILIGGLSKIGCLSHCSGDVPVILQYAPPSEQALARLDEALRQADAYDLKRMVIAERVYVLEMSRNLFASGRELVASGDNRPPLPEQMPGGPFMRWAIAGVLRVETEIIDAAGKGWPGAIDAIKAVEARNKPSLLNTLGPLLTPSFQRVVLNVGRNLAARRATHVALLIERYRRFKGRLPESQEDLEPFTDRALPLSPFTGKPLIYRVLDDGYIVYSPDETGKDHGGAKLNKGDGSDWGIRVRITPASP